MEFNTEKVLKQFSNESLVPHGFIDTILPSYSSSSGQLSELHSSASRLLSQLDHSSQELTWQLESLVSQLLRSGPRLSYEVELLRSSVSRLVTSVNDDARPKVQELQKITESNDTAAKLERLDRVKDRMQSVLKVFEEAKRFDETTITNEVLAMLEDGDVNGALIKVERTAELCKIWKGTSVYSSRTKFLASLRKRVETILESTTDTEPFPELPSRPSSSAERTSNDTDRDSYYGLIGQLQRKIGY